MGLKQHPNRLQPFRDSCALFLQHYPGCSEGLPYKGGWLIVSKVGELLQNGTSMPCRPVFCAVGRRCCRSSRSRSSRLHELYMRRIWGAGRRSPKLLRHGMSSCGYGSRAGAGGAAAAARVQQPLLRLCFRNVLGAGTWCGCCCRLSC
jgi:hypothetical protein